MGGEGWHRVVRFIPSKTLNFNLSKDVTGIRVERGF